MKNRMAAYLLTVGLTLGLAACGGREEEQPMDDQATMSKDEDLSQLRSRLMSAYGSGDARSLAQLFTEDAVLIPSVGQEIKGRQAIEQTYAALWQTWKVAQFDLTPIEGKIADDWAFERGTIKLQAVPAGAVTGQGRRPPAGGTEQPQKPGAQPGGSPGAGATGSGAAVQAVMDTSYYIFVMNKTGGDWKISWFISTNPPEYSATVTEQAPTTSTQPRQGGTGQRGGGPTG